MGARQWTCPHGVPLGTYCARCAGKGRSATLIRAYAAATIATIEARGWWR